MKDMKHRYAMLFLAFGTGSIQAQQIDLDQGNWQIKDLGTRAMQMVVQRAVRDLPMGAYSEYHPNGKIRLEGRLAGLDRKGVPLKKGEWKKFDIAGELVAVETYE